MYNRDMTETIKEIDMFYDEGLDYIKIMTAIKKLNFAINTDDIKKLRHAYGVLEYIAGKDYYGDVAGYAKEKVISLVNQIVLNGLAEIDTEFAAWVLDQQHKYCDCAESTTMEL